MSIDFAVVNLPSTSQQSWSRPALLSRFGRVWHVAVAGKLPVLMTANQRRIVGFADAGQSTMIPTFRRKQLLY